MPPDFTGHRILVWGAARSGLAAAALLGRHGADLLLADDAPREKFESRARDVLGDISLAPEGRLPRPLRDFDLVVISPGVPATHPRIAEAKALGIPVLSELEIGARFTQARLIAVTGTNGKTTVVNLAAHLLGGEDRAVFLAGNVGRALCDVVQRPAARAPESTLVVEVSSFQCEHLDRFHPHLAVVLNLRPDHFDRHGDLAGYAAAKAQMGKNLTPQDTVIVNADEPGALRVTETWAGARLPFSLAAKPRPGLFLDGDACVHDDGRHRHTLFTTRDLMIPGRHNVANALAASAVALRCGVEPAHLAERMRTFPGVPHRIEWVACNHGVDIYNDSKATNLDSMSVALEAFTRPIVLIAGGRPKGEDLHAMSEALRARVRAVVLIGEAAGDMQRAWGAAVPAVRAATLAEALDRALEAAIPGDVILLSPGCASYDMFRDYEDRGDQFRALAQAHAAAGRTQ